jgi:hypothetical protein
MNILLYWIWGLGLLVCFVFRSGLNGMDVGKGMVVVEYIVARDTRGSS